VKLRSLSLTAVLILALAGSWWLIDHSSESLEPQKSSQSNHPDSFMTNATYTKMNADGQLAAELFTPRAVHYPQNSTTHITTPKVIIYSQGLMPWHVSADYGKSIDGTKTILLWDHVKLHRDKGPHNQFMTMTTTKATLYPKRRLAITHQPVTIIQPGTVIKAVGLKANLNKGTIVLLSKAHAVYVPAKN